VAAARSASSQKQTAFLEQLPNGRHPERRQGIIGGQHLPQLDILRRQLAARKHQRTTGEIDLVVTPYHEHFQSLRPVP
jgi:hypothetical protein